MFGKYGWTAKEEQHLLDAIEQYGFGNWEDISRHIETRSSEGIAEFLHKMHFLFLAVYITIIIPAKHISPPCYTI